MLSLFIFYVCPYYLNLSDFVKFTMPVSCNTSSVFLLVFFRGGLMADKGRYKLSEKVARHCYYVLQQSIVPASLVSVVTSTDIIFLISVRLFLWYFREVGVNYAVESLVSLFTSTYGYLFLVFVRREALTTLTVKRLYSEMWRHVVWQITTRTCGVVSNRIVVFVCIRYSGN